MVGSSVLREKSVGVRLFLIQVEHKIGLSLIGVALYGGAWMYFTAGST